MPLRTSVNLIDEAPYQNRGRKNIDCHVDADANHEFLQDDTLLLFAAVHHEASDLQEIDEPDQQKQCP